MKSSTIGVFYYRKIKNNFQARKTLSDLYGEYALTRRQRQNLFTKFQSGNFNVEDALNSRRPIEVDEDTIKRKQLAGSLRNKIYSIRLFIII